MEMGLGHFGAVEGCDFRQPRAGDEAVSPVELVGDSPALCALRAFVRKLAPTQTTVLITGETGTGKEVVAAMVHRLSKRAKAPLVALNCAAIPDTLIEGELFGYERGAFSGAATAHPGKLKLADGGTVLLDEVGELSLAAQAKLLRALETGEAYPLGARRPSRFDIRIIASTNRDLLAAVEAGMFRADLYYRLAVAKIALPPLSARPEDIAPIAQHLWRRIAADAGRMDIFLDQSTLRALEGYQWPGNARELRNVLEVALINCEGDRVSAEHLPFAAPVVPACGGDERSLLSAALRRAGGNKSVAANDLRCSRMTLYRRMARAGIG